MQGPPSRGVPVQLIVKAAHLRDADGMTKSDPFAVLTNAAGAIVGRTETIQNSLSPQFATPIVTEFLFESRQDFTLTLYDDDGQQRLEANDKLGAVAFQMAQIMTSRGTTREFALPTKGTVTITAVEMANTGNDTIAIKFRGTKMKKMDTFSASDCYYQLRRLNGGTVSRTLHKSEVINDSLEPAWRPVQLLVRDLLAGNADEPTLEFACFDEDVASDEFMGSFRLSFNQLRAAVQFKTEFLLKDSEGELFGTILVDAADVTHDTTFPDYLQAGWQINLAVSVDFTGSNGDPRTPTSLHFMGNPHLPNQYVRAMMGVGSVLLQYDTDKNIAGFGFGAAFNGQTQHFFHLNMQPNPYVRGVEGLIEAYTNSMQRCTLSGPTNFGPTILAATAGARQVADDRCYSVLLLLTDGAITDTGPTIDALVAADDAPLSIVIVGVGNADFSSMDVLDGDGGPLVASSGRRARRDLVQFVPFNRFGNAPPEALAAAVLAEIPTQFMKYAQLTKRQP